jgi:anaerobic selenocysteine-containing dehydrogenase
MPLVEKAMTAPKVVRTMCPMNCHPTFCGMLVEVEDGRLKAVSGDKQAFERHSSSRYRVLRVR